MKLSKRFLALFLCLALIVPLLPASVFAAQDETVKIDNGYIEVSVSTRNGGFLVNTVTGNLLKKSDNNKKLLYHSGAYDTSFVSFRVGSGSEAKDYLFGGKYDGSGNVTVTKTAGGEIVAVWPVDGITFTQTISLASDSSDEHGMVSIGLSAANNSGRDVPVQARILLDSCLGDQDYVHYQITGLDYTNTLDTEQILTDPTSIRNFYALDDVADPSVVAYAVSTPEKVAIGHWNDLASSLFDFEPDTNMNFTNVVNEYLTADSACALYYDMGTVANGSSGTAACYYGVYSNHTVRIENRVAINAAAPMRLELNEAKDAYVKQCDAGSADFAVTISAENFLSDTSSDLKDVILAVHSTSNLRPLNDSGAAITGLDYIDSAPLTIPYSKIAQNETITKTVYFQARPMDAASYERITIGMYQGEVASDRLLGEKRVYVLLPGNDGSIPKVSFVSMNPKTVYNEGTRHLNVAVTNDTLLDDSLAAGNCQFKVYSADGKKSYTIDSGNITVNAGIADIALTDDIKMAVGSWRLQLEWSDAAVAQEIVKPEYQKQTADMLRFEVSDNPMYKNDCYGILAAVKYGDGKPNTPYYYRLLNFRNEEVFEAFAQEKNHDWTEILLVLRGEFVADNRYLIKEDGKTTGAMYYSAVSKKTVDPDTRETKVDNTITINNCVDFEGGTISVYYENYESGLSSALNSSIMVEFDGELYTSVARSSVWTGKAALTKLQNGHNYSLIHYDSNGNRKSSTAEPVTLIWPNVFSVAQTIMGMAFKMAYGQFGVMEKDGKELGRVISFSAALSLSFMQSPDGDTTDYGTASYFGRMQELWKDWRGASIYQYAYHGSRYEKLTDISVNDKDKSGDNKQGIGGSVMVQDILFGCNSGLVGLNFDVGVEIRNMVDSLPKIEGTLSINTINDWSFGLAGKCELTDKIKMEAKLKFKSKNDIPIPDELYFYIGGFKPGINADGCGVIWITGGGGGFSGLYDTIFCSSGLPPLKLIMTISWNLVQVLSGTAKLEMSLSGLNLTASDLKIFDEIEAVKKVALGLQWYPDLNLNGSIYVSMFEKTIEGQGYIVLVGKDYTDWFFEMFLRAALRIPESVPAVGGTLIAGADLGVNTEKIWGSIDVIKISVGISYYWGESSVNFGSAKDKAQPTYPNLLLNAYNGECEGIPIAYDAENDRTLYAHVGTNFEAPQEAQILAEDDLILMDAAGVWSNAEKTEHKFNPGSYDAKNNAAALVQISYPAETKAEAESVAQSFTVRDAKTGGNDLGLILYNGDNLDVANANVTWNEETKTGALSFSVTDSADYGKNWFVSTGSVSADIVLYNVLPTPKLESIRMNGPVSAGEEITVSWNGTGLDELDSIRFFLAESDDPTTDAGYPLTSDTFPNGITDSSAIQSGSISLRVPAQIPAGNYYLRAVYAKDEQLNEMIHSTDRTAMENTNTPAAAAAFAVSPCGDLKYRVSIPESADAKTAGYSVTVYEEDGGATDITGVAIEKAESGVTEFEIGGNYTAPVKAAGDDPDSATTGSENYGLEGGKKYIVGVMPYCSVDADGDGQDDAIVYGKETRSSAVLLPQAVTPSAEVSADGKTLEAVSGKGSSESGSADHVPAGPVFTKNSLDIEARFSESVSGTWTLDDNRLWDDPENKTKVFGRFDSASAAEFTLTDLTEGSHTLSFLGTAADGDRFYSAFPFNIDTQAPRLMISAPLNGGAFGKKGTLTVTGVTDPDALITASVDGNVQISGKRVAEAGGSIDADGVFELILSVPDPNNTLRHTLVISAADANGNRTGAQEITVVNPALGDLADIELMVNDALPTDGNVLTTADGSAKLSLVGVTSGGERFVLDADQVYWNSYAAEGSASVGSDGVLTYAANTRGFVEAKMEVTAGAFRTAALTLGSEPESGYVSVSGTIGGTINGGGYYTAGDTVTLTAVPDEGYHFDHWEIDGVAVSDPKAATVSFTFPGSNVTIQAVFDPDQSGNGGGGGSVPGEKPVAADYLNCPKDDTCVMAHYRDMRPTDWFHDGVHYVLDNDIMYGLSDDEFGPQVGTTRAMIVRMLWNLDGEKQVSYRMTFKDVSSGAWYADAVRWAACEGVVAGYSSERFGPSELITREQLAAILRAYAMYRGLYKAPAGSDILKPYRDRDDIFGWAVDAVAWAVENGIIGGMTKDTISPKTHATRAQVATMIMNFCTKVLNENDSSKE